MGNGQWAIDGRLVVEFHKIRYVDHKIEERSAVSLVSSFNGCRCRCNADDIIWGCVLGGKEK
eukprot:scaffold4361_cov74-Cyclotella_meneghiniana.AAC.3